VKSAPFGYDSPTTPEEVVSLLAEHGDDAKVLAGGQSLLPMLALRLAVFDRLVDVGRVEALRGVERRDGALWIGAATTDAEVERSAEAAASVPLLARATPLVGHLQIRNRGTVGGSLAHADPAAEYPAVALALDAALHVLSTGGRRSVRADGFFTGLWSTAVEADELLVGASFPVWEGRCGFAVEEYARRHGDYAIAGVALGVQLDGRDVVERCAVALFGMSSTPVRARAAEAAAVSVAAGDVDVEALARLAAGEPDGVPSDLHGSAAYRRRVCAAVVARAWSSAMGEALGG